MNRRLFAICKSLQASNSKWVYIYEKQWSLSVWTLHIFSLYSNSFEHKSQRICKSWHSVFVKTLLIWIFFRLVWLRMKTFLCGFCTDLQRYSEGCFPEWLSQTIFKGNMRQHLNKFNVFNQFSLNFSELLLLAYCCSARFSLVNCYVFCWINFTLTQYISTSFFFAKKKKMYVLTDV